MSSRYYNCHSILVLLLLSSLLAFGCASSDVPSDGAEPGILLSADGSEAVHTSIETSSGMLQVSIVDLDVVAIDTTRQVSQVVVRVLDHNGQPAIGISVYGAFRGALDESVEGSTDESGTVMFSSPAIAFAGALRFEIDWISTDEPVTGDGIETSPCPEEDPNCQQVTADGIETSPCPKEDPNCEPALKGIETSPCPKGDLSCEPTIDGIETSPLCDPDIEICGS